MQGAAWLNWAGIVTWLVVSLSTLADIAAGRFMGMAALVFVAAFLLFGLMLALCFWPASLFRVQGGLPALAIETLCGLVMVYFGDGAEGATLVIVAAQVPYFVSPPAAWGWVVLQTAALLAIFVPRAGVLEAVSGAFAFGGFQMFAVATSMLARSERTGAGITLHARDDGRGVDVVTLGNGLVGMRERFESLAGRIDVTSAAGRGFEVCGFLPARPAA